VLSDATIRRVHATAMSALSSAVKRRKIAVNPGEHVELPAGRADKPLVWTEHRIGMEAHGQAPGRIHGVDT
jgi:hypothetical protein